MQLRTDEDYWCRRRSVAGSRGWARWWVSGGVPPTSARKEAPHVQPPRRGRWGRSTWCPSPRMGSAPHLRGHGSRPGHGHLLQLLLSLLNLIRQRWWTHRVIGISEKHDFKINNVYRFFIYFSRLGSYIIYARKVCFWFLTVKHTLVLRFMWSFWSSVSCSFSNIWCKGMNPNRISQNEWSDKGI